MASISDKVHIFNPPGHPPLAPSYSHISSIQISPTHRLVSFAGQTGTSAGTDPSNPPSFPEQVRAALENVDKCLAAVGCTKRDIVMNRQFVVKLASEGGLCQEDKNARSTLFLEWWNRPIEGEKEGQVLPPPPDTLIGVDSLALREILFEIEITCIAKVQLGRVDRIPVTEMNANLFPGIER